MRMRWKAAAFILPVLAAVAGCGRDVTSLDGSAIRPRFEDYPPPVWSDSLPPDTVSGDTPYYGSGHKGLPGAADDPTIIE